MTDTPDEPMAPSVCDISSNSCRVKYQPPVVEGGTAVSGYLLQFKTPDTQLWISLSGRRVTGTSVKIRQLHSYTQYEFRVAALNSFGVGKFSPASVPITTDDTKPSQPGCPVIKSDGRSVDMEWTLQCSGTESTNFHYIILIHYHSANTDARMFVVTERKAGPVVQHSLSVELQQEILYDFAVAAVNEAGVGPYSATSQPVRFLTGQLFYMASQHSEVQHLMCVYPSICLSMCLSVTVVIHN